MMTKLNRMAPVFVLLALVLAACAAPPQPTAESVPASASLEVPSVAAVTTGEVEPVRTEGGTIVRAMTSEPPNIDPQGAPHSGLSLVLPYVFDTLVAKDIDNKVVPLLAEKWVTAPDGLAITMTLKSGVTFHDGDPLTSETVKFTFDRFKEQGKASPIYGGVMLIAEMDTPDPQTIVFRFKSPAANFFSTISMPYAGIISPKSAQVAEGMDVPLLVGTGPFRLGEWKAGQFIELVRNEAYDWGPEFVHNRGPVHIYKQILKVIPDATTQLAALEGGEVDIIFVNNPGHKQKLEANEAVEVHSAVLNSLVYLGFNTARAPFDNPLVRQALSHSIDKDAIVKVALGGVGQAAFAPLAPTLPGFDPALKEYELSYDPAATPNLLEAAGYTQRDGAWTRDGDTLTAQLLTSNRAPNETIATLIQSQLATVGVKVEIQQLDSKAVMQATTEGKFDLLLFRYDWNDPDALNIYLGSDRIGSTNRVAYKNDQVDALLKQGATELDPAARVKLYVDAQRIILEDAPWQPLYYPVDVIAVAKRVAGEKVGYMGRLLLNDAKMDE
jgi:peptide/nickel transport system substrate-binding protein